MAKRKNRAIDQAREWRERVLAEYDTLHAQEAVPGLTKHANERYVYLRLRVGESAGQQLNAVFKRWKELHALDGERRLAGVMSGGWIIILPSGEPFCAFRVAKFGALVSETDEQMVPMVDAAEAHLREFAASTGSVSGVIEDGHTFACADSRRFPLAACACRQLTDDDYNAHRRKTKRAAVRRAE